MNFFENRCDFGLYRKAEIYRRLYAVPDYSYAGHFEMEFKFDVPQCSKTPNLLWREPKRIVNQFLEALEFKSF